MQNPLLFTDHGIELGEGSDCGRVEKKCARPAPEDLNEVGPLRVPETGGSFRIDRDGSVPSGKRGDSIEVFATRRDDMHVRMLRDRRRRYSWIGVNGVCPGCGRNQIRGRGVHFVTHVPPGEWTAL